MRIAILNWSNRRIGGTGTYLSSIIPYFRRAGHEVSFWYEVEEPRDREPIPIPADAPVWSVEALGLDAALAALAEWRPDVLYAHGLLDPAIEGRTLDIAPGVFFAHNFYGTCISGAKTFKNPTIVPCQRNFGWPCLVQYYPRRCGGWNPVTMVREFQRQGRRLDLLPRYKAIVTHSTYMQQEYLQHGLHASQVFNVRYGSIVENGARSEMASGPEEHCEAWKLLFVGRMDELKGGRELIDALPQVVRELQHDVHVTFAGDGPRRRDWERRAAAACAREPKLRLDFPGWVEREGIERLFAQADLLVLPSLWPEPFALVGLEAARHGLPVAAFAVGGIPDWLQSGFNGYLAPGEPPTVDGLAGAIISCLKDPQTHARLREGAISLSAEYEFDRHVAMLLPIFEQVVKQSTVNSQQSTVKQATIISQPSSTLVTDDCRPRTDD